MFKSLSMVEVSDISAATGIGNISEAKVAKFNDVILILKMDEEDFVSIRNLSRVAEYFGVSQEDVVLNAAHSNYLEIDIMGQSVFDYGEGVDDYTDNVDDKVVGVDDSEEWEAFQALRLSLADRLDLSDADVQKAIYNKIHDLYLKNPEPEPIGDPSLPFIEYGGNMPEEMVRVGNTFKDLSGVAFNPVKKDSPPVGCCGSGRCPGCPSARK